MDPWCSNTLNSNRPISPQFEQTLNALIKTLIKPETLKRDLFFALILIVMKENDFVLKGNVEIDVVDCILAKRRQGVKAYELTVVLTTFQDTPAKIIVCSLDDTILINSFIDISKETHSLCLPIHQYLITSSLGIPCEFSSFPELYVTLREQIVSPMKNSILHYHSVPYNSLPGLPNDVLFQILLGLPLSDILNISESCKKLSKVVKEENLWSRLLRRDFPRMNKNNEVDWHSIYKDVYTKKLKKDVKGATAHSVRDDVIDEALEADYLPVKESRWEVIL